MRGFAFFATLVLSAAPVAVAQQIPADELARRVDTLFAPWDGPARPGCVVGIVKDGELILERAYGLADVEHGVSLSTASVFDVASESKQFTAACVILAARQHGVPLDRDVRAYLPELPEYGDVITIRHLLTHTSGVRDYGTLRIMAGGTAGDRHTTADTLDLIARQRELNFAPGEAFLYSNSGYLLLAVLVERITGQSLRAFAAASIFGPLGMDDTRYADDHTEAVPRGARGHVRRPDGTFGRADDRDDVVGPGGLITTLGDLTRWDRNFYADQLGDGTLVETLLSPGVLRNGETLDYAAGLVRGDFDGLATVSHGGATAGFRSLMLRFPEMRLTVICLSNLGSVNVPALAWRTAVTAAYGPFVEETARLQNGTPPVEFVDLPRDALETWAGDYRQPHTRQVWSVEITAGAVRVDDGRGGFGVRPLSATRFRKPGRGQTIEIVFSRGEAGVRSMRLEIEEQRPEIFEAVARVAVEPGRLAEYAGAYTSDEIGADWSIEVRDGRLHFGGPGAPAEPLRPTIEDEFTLGSELVVSFDRGPRGRITSMRAHTARVWSLRFERRPDPATPP